MLSENFPSQNDFINSPVEVIRNEAPKTFIYAASGTRRAAALAGIPAAGEAFAQWTQGQLFDRVEMIFDHGVEHLCMPMLGPSQFEETTGEYREHLWRWFREGLAGSMAIKHYRKKGWRVRIAFSDYMPELKESGQRLIRETPQKSAKTLWCFVIPTFEQTWEWVLDATQKAKASNYAGAIRALYGDDIPSATMYLSTGKPLISTLQLPPLLISEVAQCYWSQRPGYSLTQRQFRQMIYDSAYARKTWKKDKSGRAEEILANRQIWENGSIFGLGERMGSFWYPKDLGVI